MNDKSRTASLGSYVRFQTSILNQLPRPVFGELSQTRVDYWNNNQEELKRVLAKVLYGPTFSLIKKFEITVPDDYNHDRYLNSFNEIYWIGRIKVSEDKKSLYRAETNSPKIAGHNWENTTGKLQANKKYLIKIFKLGLEDEASLISSESCVEFIKDKSAIFAGIQGLTLAWHLKKNEFPEGATICIGREDLAESVPSIVCSKSKTWSFHTNTPKGGWGNKCHLLCFYEI